MADDEQLHRSILYRLIIDDRLKYDCAPLVSVYAEKEGLNAGD